MKNNYPLEYKDLLGGMSKLGDELQSPMKSFSGLYEQSTKAGHLTSKHKELIALGIAIAVHCDDCIPYHIHNALNAGATRQEVLETIGVAIMMGGSPAMLYGAEALEAMNQFKSENAE
jgi:AhpD family alkylhydroperoxidase